MRRSSWLKSRSAERVLVHSKTGKSIRGYLETATPDGLLLRAPVLLLDEVETPLAGELWVYAADVEFVQLGNFGEID